MLEKTRRSNQSVLKEIKLEGLLLKLKLQYFAYLLWRANSLEKTLMLGKIEGRRRQRLKWLDGIIDLLDMSLSNLPEIVKDREAWRATVHGVAKNWTWLRDWTTKASGQELFFCRYCGGRDYMGSSLVIFQARGHLSKLGFLSGLQIYNISWPICSIIVKLCNLFAFPCICLLYIIWFSV